MNDPVSGKNDRVVRFHVRYALLLFLIFAILMAAFLILLTRQYKLHDASERRLLLNRFMERSSSLDHLLADVIARVEGIRITAEDDLMQTRHVKTLIQPLAFNDLKESFHEDGKSFNLDEFKPPVTESTTGNLTGEGSVLKRDPSFYREIHMALNLNPQFAAVSKSLKDAAWVYYTSANDFINIYPWVSSKDFRFSKELQSHEFFVLGLPRNNPERKIFWTDVYIDEYGKGLMTTCAAPVYDGDTFLGTVAIDLTVDFLNTIIKDFEGGQGVLFLVNDRDQLLAHPTLVTSRDKQTKSLREALPGALGNSIDGFLRIPDNEIAEMDSFSVLKSHLHNAAWQIAYVKTIPSFGTVLVERIGTGALILLSGLLILVVTISVVTHTLFILPSEKFVNFILARSGKDRVPMDRDVPKVWEPWFNTIENIFRENEELTEKVRKQNEELEERVEERTAELGRINDRLMILLAERKGAEKALRESESKLAGIIEFLPDATFVIDLEGKVIAWNRAIEEMTGVGKKDMLGQGDHAYTVPFYGERRKHLLDLIDADDKELESRYQNVQRKGSILHAEAFTPALYGGKGAYVFAAGASLFDIQGNRVGAIESIRDITDRRRAEAKLKEAYDIISKSPVVAFLWKNAPGWPVEFVTDNVEMLFGYKAGEFTSGEVPYSGTIHPDDLERVAGEVADFSRDKGGVAFDHEPYRIVTKDGKTKWVNDSTFIRRNEKGDITHYQGLLSDITDRRRTEEALIESEERYKTYVENSFAGVYVVQNGRFVFLNSNAASFAGYKPEDLIGRLSESIVHSEDLAVTKKNARRMLKGENLSPYEFRIVTKDGQIRWIMETVTPIKYDGRDAVLGNSMDITGSKESDDALKIRDELERSIFLSVPHALFGVEQRRIFFANDAMEDVFGWKPEELIGKSTRVIFRNNEEWEEYGVLLYSQLQKLPVFKFESGIPFMRKDGREIFCRMSVSRVGKELGERRRIVATFEDITHLKREEEEKRKLEFQLVQAQKMEAVGTLAGGVAHDFNNLLMTMQGNTSMMLQDLDPSHPHNEYLKSIERQIRSAANLTKQLLGFAREGHYDVKPTDINEVVEKTAFMFGRTKKEITIQRKYGENLWSVDADADQMGQVLMNLFVNSWQAMPAGGNLFLETRNVILDESYVEPYKAVPGRYVKISVTDTGTGMDEKTKQRIFDPFFTTKELGRGTGLGLSMAYGIIRRHKGFVNVYSEPGHGTTFDIYLPASEREAVPEAATSQDIIRGTGTVLLVDDEAQVLKVSRRMLERLGYTVISTQNGKEAVELYQERKDGIDIVLLDMIMPGMSGEKVFQALREMNPAVRVILLSGYSINGQAKSILESGCNGFLQKPVSLRELSQKIDEVLRLKTEE